MARATPLSFPEGDAFEEAVLLDVEERARFLERLRLDEPALFEKVARLLEKSSELDAARARDLTAGARLGSYTLVRLLGEGGFGQVWHATQPEMPPVALKVARAFTGRSEELRKRLEVERKALARLRHRGIAGIRGWGLEPVAYFAMDLVDGVPITDYAKAHRSTLEERVDLAIDLCEALEHAHAESVLHRDLKPSNVLVEVQGERACVKVIDFGIARLMDAAGSAEPALTVEGEFRGTPGYMSPEQASGQGELGVWTDVFGAGRILFELLTGEPAISPGRSGPEALRALLEDDPPSPRERAAALGAAAPRIPADLDTITTKAMARRPEQRYGSAADMRRDLAAWRAGEPIQARRPGVWVRAGRAARRHRAVLIPAAILVVALLAVLAAIEQGRRRAEAERARQERTTAALVRHLSNLDVAELARGLRDETTAQLVRNLGVANEDELPPAVDAIDFTSLARSYFDISYLERAEAAFRAELVEDPLVLAELLGTVASARLSLHLTEGGVRAAKDAFEAFERELGPLDPKTLEAQQRWVGGLVLQRDTDTLVREAEALVGRCAETFGAGSGETLRARISRARAWAQDGRAKAAEDEWTKLCQDIEARLDPIPSGLTAAWTDLAEQQFGDARYGDAAATLRRAKEVASGPSADEFVIAQVDLALARALATPAQLGDTSGLEEARALMRPAAELVLDRRGDEHGHGLAALNSLSILARATGDTDLLLEAAQRTFEGYRRANGSRDPSSVMLQANVVMALVEAGRFEEADAVAEDVLEANGALRQPVPAVAAAVTGERGRVRAALGDFAGAEPLLLDCFEQYAALVGAQHPQSQQIARLLAQFYGEWHAADGSLGKDEESARWSARAD